MEWANRLKVVYGGLSQFSLSGNTDSRYLAIMPKDYQSYSVIDESPFLSKRSYQDLLTRGGEFQKWLDNRISKVSSAEVHKNRKVLYLEPLKRWQGNKTNYIFQRAKLINF